jgi:hypothetical protein
MVAPRPARWPGEDIRSADRSMTARDGGRADGPTQMDVR